MTKPKIGIIISTTREGRFGDKPAQWIFDIANRRHDADFELVDLRDYPIPMYDEPVPPARSPSPNEAARAFARKVGELDGFLFITAEYNHSITAVLKNALDHVGLEWRNKPAGFLGYGGTGGARAVEQLRLIAIELSLAPTRAAVHIGMEPYLGVLMQGKTFDDFPYLVSTAGPMLDELVWYAKTLKAGRDLAAEEAAVAA